MSCYLVGSDEIRAIARHLAPTANVDAETLGAMLAVANVEACIHRYGDRHGPVAGGFLNSEDELMQFYMDCESGPVSDQCPEQLIGTYVYQACDHDNWENLPIRHYLNGGHA